MANTKSKGEENPVEPRMPSLCYSSSNSNKPIMRAIDFLSMTSSPHFSTPDKVRSLPLVSPSPCNSPATRAAKRRKGSVDAAVQSVSSLSPHFLTPKATRTCSFEAVWAGTFPSLAEENIKVHTLILGTHPSITSLKENQYFAHPMNAFWWIAGDCLGFRRASGTTKSGTPYKFTSELRYDTIISYPEQLELLCSKGFAIWDVVKDCERKGSFDKNIKMEVANDIVGFCESHPHIQRLVIANGGTGSAMFVKHFRNWWLDGALQAGENEESQKAFAKLDKRVAKRSATPISCISAIPVSPAAARWNFQAKRDFWERHVYQPGLKMHHALRLQSSDSPHQQSDNENHLPFLVT